MFFKPEENSFLKSSVLEKKTVYSTFVLIHFAVKIWCYLLSIVHFMNMQIEYVSVKRASENIVPK